MKKKQVIRLKEHRQQLYQTIKNLSFKDQKEILKKWMQESLDQETPI